MLTADQRRSLRCLAEIMIPANAEYGVPGAGDDAIFAEILRNLGRDAEHVVTLVLTLDEIAGGVFVDMEAARRCLDGLPVCDGTVVSLRTAVTPLGSALSKTVSTSGTALRTTGRYRLRLVEAV